MNKEHEPLQWGELATGRVELRADSRDFRNAGSMGVGMARMLNVKGTEE